MEEIVDNYLSRLDRAKEYLESRKLQLTLPMELPTPAY